MSNLNLNTISSLDTGREVDVNRVMQSVDYVGGLVIDSRDTIVTVGNDRYALASDTPLPYTTTGAGMPEGGAFVAAGDAALRQELELGIAGVSSATGQESVSSALNKRVIYLNTLQEVGAITGLQEGHQLSIKGVLYKIVNGAPVKAVAEGPAHPAMQDTPMAPAISYGLGDGDYSVIRDGVADDFYYFGANIDQGKDGRIHKVYAKGLLHGYGGFLEADNIDPEGVVAYCYSDDRGATWSDEQIVAAALPPSPENVLRTIFGVTIGVTPSGRIVVVACDVPPPSSQWGRYTGSTKYRWFINDENGAPEAWVDKGVFKETFDDYARVYCTRIKRIPAIGGGERMALCDYRRVNGDPIYTIGLFYSDDEFETAPVEGTPIMYDDGANNETDFTFVDAMHGYAMSRSNGNIRRTNDGGQTWVKIGDSSNYGEPLINDFIAPALNTVWRDGVPYILLGWTERGVSPRKIRWSVAPVSELRKFETEVSEGRQYMPWYGLFQTGPDIVGSSGYHSAIIMDDETLLYADCTEEAKSPTTGYMTASTRIVRAPIGAWFPVDSIMVGSKTSRLNQYNDNELPTILSLYAPTMGTTVIHAQQGYHMRIGRTCWFGAYVSMTSITGFVGVLSLEGLPFTATNDSGAPNMWVSVEIASNHSGNVTKAVGLVIKNTKRIQLYNKNPTTNALSPLENSDIGTTFTAYISGFYFCRYQGPEGL